MAVRPAAARVSAGSSLTSITVSGISERSIREVPSATAETSCWACSWRVDRGWDWVQGTERRAATRSRTTDDCTAEAARRGIATTMSRSSAGAWRARMALSLRSSWRVSSAVAWALWVVGVP